MNQRKPRRSTVLLALVACALLLGHAGAGARSHGGHGGGNVAGRFDYYLMSLSWSPSYCLTHLDDADECDRGFGFVLHGLWPQYRNGSWPQHCGTHAAPDAATIRDALAFMPSRRLIEHEWQTHGSCSGLDPAAYFARADRAFAGVAIPPALKAPRAPPALSADEIVRAFAAANPGLDDSMLSVVCRDGGGLSEVRVCLDKDSLQPRACGGRVRNSCRYGKLHIPAAR
jgi:ribonuclease T2